MTLTPPPSALAPTPKRKSKRDQVEERRVAKLAFVREQVAAGSLIIRQMTAEERLLYPPVPPRSR